MKIFITGATGYIGGSLATRLVATGHELRGLVRSDERAKAVTVQGMTPALGDLADVALLGKEAGQADIIVSAASTIHAHLRRRNRLH